MLFLNWGKNLSSTPWQTLTEDLHYLTPYCCVLLSSPALRRTCLPKSDWTQTQHRYLHVSLRNLSVLQVFLNDSLQYKARFYPVMNQCYQSSFIARNNLLRTRVRPPARISFENKTSFYNVPDTEQMRGLLHNAQSCNFTRMLCSSHGSPVQCCRVQPSRLAADCSHSQPEEPGWKQ